MLIIKKIWGKVLEELKEWAKVLAYFIAAGILLGMLVVFIMMSTNIGFRF